MKFDIEGGEEEVFRTIDKNLLGRVSAIVIEFHERFFAGSSRPFYEAIKSLRHTEAHQGENSWFFFQG